MKSYSQWIKDTKLVDEVSSTLTTGDLDYCGTALEISEKDGEELFHVVVDETGRRYIMLFAHSTDYRVPVELLERIIAKANESVCCEDGTD